LDSSELFFPKLVRRIYYKQRRLRDHLQEFTALKFSVAVVREIGKDDISNMAASIAYYAFLSLFPLLLALIAILGIFLPSSTTQQDVINLFAQYLPGSVGILQGSITDIIRFRGAFGIVAILGLVWSGSGVFSAVSHGINRAWDTRYEHPFYIKKPREIGMVIAAGILFLLSMGASEILTLIGSLNLPFSGFMINIGTAVIAFAFSLSVFTLVHKFTPVIWISWRHIWPGALLSTVLFEIAKTVFVVYLNHYSSYDKIYGSIASVIVLLVWIYYSSFILLLGAEFSSMLFRLKREGAVPGNQVEKTDLAGQFQE
jgi:membrane protein